MPSVRTVKNKFEEFKRTLTSSKDALSRQKYAYDSEKRQQEAAYAESFTGLLDNLSDDAIQRLQTCLVESGSSLDIEKFIAEKRDNNTSLQAQANAIDAQYGDATSVEDKVAAIEAEYEAIQDQIPAVKQRLQTLRQKFAIVADYNAGAEKAKKAVITSENSGDFKRHWFWHMTAGIFNRDEAGVSSYLKAKPAGQFQEEYKEFEDQNQAVREIAVAIARKEAELSDAAKQSKAKSKLLSGIMDDADISKSLAIAVKAELRNSKALCSAIAEEFGQQGQDAVLAYSKSVALEKLSSGMGYQIDGLSKAIRDIEKPLPKLRRAARNNGSKNVRVDLNKIERSIKEGKTNIDAAIPGLNERLTRVNSFTPSNNDGGMFFNYLLLYVLFADSIFDGANVDAIGDLALGDAFGDAMPDLSSLDMGSFEMANLASLDIGGLNVSGLDISVPTDVLSGLSGLDSISTIDVGSSIGGFDGGMSGF